MDEVTHKEWIKGISARIEIEEFPEPERFPGLDALINAVPTRQPWESVGFLDRHFELVNWPALWRSLSGPIPGLTMDTDPAGVLVYRLSDKPIIVAVISPHPWWVSDPAVTKQKELRFYRLRWHLWWRKVDPMKDAKLRGILEGAMALDALAGRDP